MLIEKTATILRISRQCVQIKFVEDIVLEIVFTRAAPAFDNLFMGCVFNINTAHKTVEKLTFQAFYWSSQLSLNLLKKE